MSTESLKLMKVECATKHFPGQIEVDLSEPVSVGATEASLRSMNCPDCAEGCELRTITNKLFKGIPFVRK